MKHQRQETNQCLLTSIAMVADKPVAVCRELWRACNHKREYFEETDLRRQDPRKRAAGAATEWYRTYNTICNVLGLRFTYPWRESWSSGLDSHIIERYPTEQELTGKGIISIAWAIGAHAVAFENGMVYDPNGLTPLSAKAWATWAERSYGGKVYACQINHLRGTAS